MYKNTSAISALKNQSRLSGKDLIHVGIYSAIYCVITFAAAMLGYIPILMPLLCVIIPIIGGVPFMLFLTKAKKFGMILIMSVIMGIFMALTGMGIVTLSVGVVSGLIAEFVWKRAGYSKAGASVVVCGVFSIWLWGNFIPIILDPAGYFAVRPEYGADYAAAMAVLFPPIMNLVLPVTCFVCGLVGGLFGRILLKKHFVKAGIA
jgi:energy-coupling factor transport system substrate-specific component